ncbi:MAG: CYTH domain-containing protein [Phascolarctobacterium sp.]|nr:CYTH domain-containing protein [Phascolarctobacterium sp.]
MNNNREVELKLLVNRGDLKRLLASPLLQKVIRPGSEKKRRLVSSYYDTADLSFKEHGIAYRVRDRGDGTFEATVKISSDAAAGLSERMELTLPIKNDEPHLEGFDALGLDYELTELAPNGVRKLFTVDVERITYILDLPDGTVAELAIDKGKIITDKKRKPIEEIEIEVLKGSKGALLAFAERATHVVPLFAERRSKYARGMELLGIQINFVQPKIKMNSDGNTRREVLKVVQRRADSLLTLQNDFKTTALPENVRLAIRELLYLRSFLRFGSVFSPADTVNRAEVIIDKWLEALESLKSLNRLQKLWKRIVKRNAMLLGNNVLSDRLKDVKQEATVRIRLLAAAGTLSQAIFGVLSWLYNQTWQNEEYLETGNSVRCRLLDWQGDLEKAETSEEKAVVLANMLYLMKSMQEKGFGKVTVKNKERRTIIRDLRARRFTATLQLLGRGTDSRVLNRNLGAVIGWLAAKKEL